MSSSSSDAGDHGDDVAAVRGVGRCHADPDVLRNAHEQIVQRKQATASLNSIADNERLGFLVHELRNHLQTATMAFWALEAGKLSIGGSTSALVKRSLTSLATLLDESISDVRLSAAGSTRELTSVASFVTDAAAVGLLQAETSGCTLDVRDVDPRLFVTGNRALLSAALVNLLQNAIKFTRHDSTITLTAHRLDQRVLVDVQDQCGGLPSGATETLFKPFKQVGSDRTGLGLGLSVARRSVEAYGGSLTVIDLPGRGCIFTINLPLHVEDHNHDPPLRDAYRSNLPAIKPDDEVMKGAIDTVPSDPSHPVGPQVVVEPPPRSEEPINDSPSGGPRSADAPTLIRLLASVAVHDHDAFRQLYDATAPKLFAIALRIVRERSQAQDVLQDSFVNIWNCASRYKPTLATPMAWLVTIVRNRALDYIRRTDRLAVELDAELEATLELQQHGPAELAMHAQDADAVRRYLKRLDAGQRQVIAFTYFHGLTHSELAATMRIPIGTAKTWIRRGLEKMRVGLEGHRN